jgi:hypothetical protein
VSDVLQSLDHENSSCHVTHRLSSTVFRLPDKHRTTGTYQSVTLCGVVEGGWFVNDTKEVAVMQRSDVSSQRFCGETNCLMAGFSKRVLTVRPSLALPLLLTYRSVAVVLFC